MGYSHVDDIIACFNVTNTQLNTFGKFINTSHPKIKITMESKDNDKFKFLDLTMKKVDGKHDFR